MALTPVERLGLIKQVRELGDEVAELARARTRWSLRLDLMPDQLLKLIHPFSETTHVPANLREVLGDLLDPHVRHLTAPSFGPVHNRPDRGTCRCGTRHSEDDPALGTALDPASYDYSGAVLFNNHAGELWVLRQSAAP